MKGHSLLTGFLLVAVLLLSVCSKEDIPLPSLAESHSYSGSNLKLRYGGELMPAKEVVYTPSEGGNSPMLTFKGITDLNQLSSLGFQGTTIGPGVLPGSPVVSMPVEMSQHGDRYEFNGSGETEYLSSFGYSGYLQGDSCIIDISDVRLANEFLAGTVWKPVPIVREGLSYKTLPFRLIWEINPMPELGLDFNLTPLLEALFTVPVVPVYHDTAYSSLAQLYSSSVQTVAFKENGNIIVRYFSSVGGATQLVTSVGNTLQYVLPSDNIALIYPNPTSLFGLWLVAQSDPGDNPDITFTPSKAVEEGSLSEELLPLLKGLIPVILQNCTGGIPVQIETEEETLSLFVDTNTILNLLSEVVKALEENPDVISTLLSKLGLTDLSPEIIEQLEDILPALKKVLLNTTKIEIGLNFEKY